MRMLMLSVVAAIAVALPAQAEDPALPPVPGAQPGQVQVACMSWAQMKALFTKRHEVPVSRGLATEKSMVVVTASVDGASWSLLAVGIDGTTCLLAWGEGYEPGALPVLRGTAE